ncbi:hypothetical protein [Galactobacter valiniphilus]|uniref:hypothetical protein n=1 Tax=Galactobacter valiniphilus TaxID=2676122 RepID=UPI0011C476CA|nr:hypothetical protein [Galactobacter valiniphilus]
MKRPALTLLAVAGLALTACAGQTEAAPVTVTETVPATSSAAATPTQDETRPAYSQWAKEAKSPVLEWANTWQSEGCDDNTGSGKCSRHILNGLTVLKDLAVSMASAMRTDGAGYLGERSAAVGSELESIRVALGTASKNGTSWAEAGCAADGSGAKCPEFSIAFADAMTEVSQGLGSLSRP